jgi:hypothetical protein
MMSIKIAQSPDLVLGAVKKNYSIFNGPKLISIFYKKEKGKLNLDY